MKMRIKSLFVLMAIMCSLTFVTSCNKSDNHSWEARVLEFGSNKPIPNATVYLVEKRGEDILGPVGSTVVDSVTTGADGKFKFKFIDGPVAHYIRGKADLYYETELSRNGNSPSKTKKDLILDPHAWLRIHVKNVNPVDENDAMTLQNQGCSYKVFKGNNIDEYHICTAKGNRNEVLKYTVSKIGQGAGVKYEINYQSGSRDTTDILIEY